MSGVLVHFVLVNITSVRAHVCICSSFVHNVCITHNPHSVDKWVLALCTEAALDEIVSALKTLTDIVLVDGPLIIYRCVFVTRCRSVSDNDRRRCRKFVWFVPSHGKTVSPGLGLLHRLHLLDVLHLLG